MKCIGCKGIDYCNQQDLGYKWEVINGKPHNTRCDYTFRGGFNDKLLKRDKFKTFNCDNWDEIRVFINDHRGGYMYSNYGKGKTHLMYYLANLYNLQGHSVHIELFADISRKVKQEFNNNKNGIINKSLVDQMLDVKILFLGDLGNEKITEYVASDILQIVIDYRYKNEKPTFISSNYTLGELYDIYKPVLGDIKTGQLLSRIKTFGVIEIKGKNWRGSE